MLEDYIKPNWPQHAAVKAYTTTRKLGGKQPTSNYANFNLGTHVNDDPATVHANRLKLIQELQLPEMPTWLDLVHGNDVVALMTDSPNHLTADACFTFTANKVCAVTTADCLPILLYHRDGKAVAAIHGGWRSLFADIIAKTVNAMGLEAAELHAWLGPAISAKNYTVGNDLREQFIKQSTSLENAFYLDNQNWKCDLYKIAQIKLKKLGINSIFGGNYCTYAQNDLFYSYRRDGQQSGRLVTLVWINR